MPITAGQNNPNWTREETILALDVYFKHDGPIYRQHADVMELSTLLRSAGLAKYAAISDSFRNADGVALKLQNLHAAITGNASGLSSSIGDRTVASEFQYPDARHELTDVAQAIRNAMNSVDTTKQSTNPYDVPIDAEFKEGETVTRTHQLRERDKSVRRKALDRCLKKHGKLVCELCGFDANGIDTAFADSMFEAHHIVPLSEATGQRNTRLSDISLLCACCHRFIHRLIASKKQWMTISEARQARTGSK